MPVTNGLACSAEHAPLAEQLARVQSVSARNTGLHGMQRWLQPIAGISLGALGANWAYSNPTQPFGWILLAAGCLLAGVALLGVFRSR